MQHGITLLKHGQFGPSSSCFSEDSDTISTLEKQVAELLRANHSRSPKSTPHEKIKQNQSHQLAIDDGPGKRKKGDRGKSKRKARTPAPMYWLRQNSRYLMPLRGLFPPGVLLLSSPRPQVSNVVKLCEPMSRILLVARREAELMDSVRQEQGLHINIRKRGTCRLLSPGLRVFFGGARYYSSHSRQ